MTTLLDAPPVNVVDALRGDRSTRPMVDRTSAAGLRAQLEDGIFDITGGATTASMVVIRSSSLGRSPRTTDVAMSPQARLRGVLVSQVLRLLCVGASIDDPFNDAVAAWRGENSTGDLLEHFERLDHDEHARLATDVTAHSCTLGRSLGSVSGQWMARTALRASQRLSGGAVTLRDLVDLVVGTANGDVASVALLDVTTAPLGEGAERAMRYHALVQTLRTSTVPLRTSAFSTATGELWLSDVDHQLLARSVDEVLSAVHDQWTSR